jgi:hypothetical protein
VKHKAVILLEHIHFDGERHAVYINQYPCGTLSYKKSRKRHSWVLIKPFGIITYHEDYARCCNDAKPGDHIVLEIDGVRTNRQAQKPIKQINKQNLNIEIRD